MTRIRTFIAVAASSAVHRRAAELQDRLRRSGVKATWVDPQKMHLTLRFLGDVDETAIPDVCTRVMAAVEPFEPFPIGFAGAGAFPSRHRPRTLWIGVDEGRQRLVELQFAVQESLVAGGFPPERKTYRPHLTIARIRERGPRVARLAELLARDRDLDAGSCEVTEVLVMASTLHRSGPTYRVMARAPLTA